ncbi:MAG: hypothetical protein IJ594_04500 [Oscillospiraceae bacterium]|nr:hypothetical protein [Oscillospiraceae bacterium]
MEKIKSFLKKAGQAMNDPRYIKPLLIAICCLTVLLSGLIVAAGLRVRSARIAQQAALEAMAAEDEDAGKLIASLAVTTAWEDLRIVVCNGDGAPLTAAGFPLRVTYPNGESFSFMTADNGECCLSGLPAGEYAIELLSTPEYAAYGPLHCSVEGVFTLTDGAGGTPVLDDKGDPVYTYRALLGPHGYLLSRETHEESRVLPVDADHDGVPDYGLRFVPEQTLTTEDGETRKVGAYCYKVDLIRRDNTPQPAYAILAVPRMESSNVLHGWQFTGEEVYYYRDGYRLVGLQRIDGKLYYFDPDGVRAESLGIDVSYYNEDIDWKTVKAQGIDFAVVRIGGRGWSSGAPYGDVRTHEYLLGAQAAGVKVGVYFYTTAINLQEAVEEAQFALRTLNGIRLDLPIFIDMEYSGEYPWGRADRLTAAERTQIIRAFCETVRCAGYEAGIYSGQYFYQRSLSYPAVSQYVIWMANYTYYGQLPDFDRRYDIWQFTDRGSVVGVSGHSDMNVIF